jgi:hypothetical protein
VNELTSDNVILMKQMYDTEGLLVIVVLFMKEEDRYPGFVPLPRSFGAKIDKFCARNN